MSRRLLLLVYPLFFINQTCHRNTHQPGGALPEEMINIRIDQQQGEETGPCEPSIAINPNNPNQLVAGAVLHYAYHSNDGGRTWQKQILQSSMGVWGDPVVLADYKNNFYYAHLSDPAGTNWASQEILDRMVVQKSTDAGASWSDGTYTGLRHPKDQDKEWLAVDPQSNYLFMTWTEFDKYGSRNPKDHSRILFSKSTDDGLSWSTPVVLSQFEGNCLDDDQTTEGAVPAVGPNGELYVAWSFDEKIYFDRSFDGGHTWMGKDLIISDQPGGWSFEVPGLNRTNGMPVTAVDISQGAYRGHLYVNWSDQRNGEDDTDVWLSKSTDGGDTWTAPIRVNDDDPGKHNFLTWLTIDPTTGYVYLVFYDRRNHENESTDVYLAISKDGGQTFINQKINQQSFSPNRHVFFGDYNHIVAYDGHVRPIWTQYENGKLSIWTALIDF